MHNESGIFAIITAFLERNMPTSPRELHLPKNLVKFDRVVVINPAPKAVFDCVCNMKHGVKVKSAYLSWINSELLCPTFYVLIPNFSNEIWLREFQRFLLKLEQDFHCLFRK
jgi:hypothetical protein